MGSVFKENHKRISRKNSISASDNFDILRYEDQAKISTNASGILGYPINGIPSPGFLLQFDGTQWQPVSSGVVGVDLTSLSNGSESSPVIAWASNPNTGFYQISDILNVAIASNQIISISAAGITLTNNVSTGINLGSVPKEIISHKITTEASAALGGNPNTILAGETPKLFHNEGTSGENHHNLPTAAAGLRFTFIVQDANGMQVNASSGDTIRIASNVSSTGGNASSTTTGDVLSLVALNATEWVSTSPSGNWTLA